MPGVLSELGMQEPSYHYSSDGINLGFRVPGFGATFQKPCKPQREVSYPALVNNGNRHPDWAIRNDQATSVGMWYSSIHNRPTKSLADRIP